MTVLADLNLKPFGKRINDRRTYAVQTSRNLITAAAEFTACVKNGKNNRNRRETFLLVNAYGNSSSVILYGNYVIG